MTVFLSSTRPAKIDGARDALAAIATVDARFQDVRVETYDLTAIAPRMPMSEVEVIDGARRRARALIESPRFAFGEAFAVGLEGGLSPLDVGGAQVWTLQTWAAVTDGTSWGYGGGGALTIPGAIGKRVAAGEELGELVDRLAGSPTRGTRGAWGVLTRDLTGRRDAFRLAVLAAFAPFYNKATYDLAI